MSRSEPSIGVDCTEVSRWRRVQGPVMKLFTPFEHEHCRAQADVAASYALVWAAKEAVYKCLSPAEPVDLRRIEIGFDAQGTPFANFPGVGPLSGLQLSLTRSGDLALAVAVRR
jgi:phosphopantetheine--protein transferase-like protein